MSGGRFDYKQDIIDDIIDVIEEEIKDIDANVEEEGQQEQLLGLMKSTIGVLKLAKVSVVRLDWYLSGDDSFETYKQRLSDEIAEILDVNRDKEEV